MKEQPVSIETANLIRKLIESLKAEFGCDYAFTILGKGHIIAASNYKDGIILPTIKG